MKRFYIYILLLSLIIYSSCEEQAKNDIFGAPVDFKIYLDAWDDELKSPGVYKVFTSPDETRGRLIGYGGLLVVSGVQLASSSSNAFPLYAYDLACPHEQNPQIKVEVKNLEAVCSKCKSTFDILNGTGVKTSGPADSGLQRYTVTSYNTANNIYRIIR